MAKFRTALALGAVLAVAACASPSFDAQGPGATRQTGAGPVLVDGQGMTLYVYDKDNEEKSACTGLCTVAWPPAEAAPGAKPHDQFTLIEREDGTRQWAYNGRPLYGYIGDSEPGDVTGDGVESVWHAARP